MSLKAERNKKKIANKARKGFKGHPLATIAYYGPTDKKELALCEIEWVIEF